MILLLNLFSLNSNIFFGTNTKCPSSSKGAKYFESFTFSLLRSLNKTPERNCESYLLKEILAHMPPHQPSSRFFMGHIALDATSQIPQTSKRTVYRDATSNKLDILFEDLFHSLSICKQFQSILCCLQVVLESFEYVLTLLKPIHSLLFLTITKYHIKNLCAS